MIGCGVVLPSPAIKACRGLRSESTGHEFSVAGLKNIPAMRCCRPAGEAVNPAASKHKRGRAQIRGGGGAGQAQMERRVPAGWTWRARRRWQKAVPGFYVDAAGFCPS